MRLFQINTKLCYQTQIHFYQILVVNYCYKVNFLGHLSIIKVDPLLHVNKPKYTQSCSRNCICYLNWNDTVSDLCNKKLHFSRFLGHLSIFPLYGDIIWFVIANGTLSVSINLNNVKLMNIFTKNGKIRFLAK